MKYSIKDIADINRNSLKKEELKKIVYLDTANLTKNKINELVDYDTKIDKIPSRAKRKVEDNDILISTVRPNQEHYGILKNTPDNLIVSTGFAVITPKSNLVDPYYLYALLTQKKITNYLQVVAENSTSAYPSIKPSVIANLEIDLLTLNKQKSIGKFFKSLEYKIELNKQIISNLEELASTLFKRWFVDFEFPDENGNPYKSSGGKMVDNELGKIPEGWEATSLSDIANYKNGLAMQKFRPDEDEKSLPVLKIKELNQGFTDSNSDRCSIDISDEVKIENGDVVFSWSGTLLAKIWTGGDAGLNQHLFKVTSNKFPKWYYYLWTKFYMNKFIGIAKDKATTMGHIKRQHLNEAKVLIPSINMLEKFGKVLGPTIDMVTEKGIENLELSNLRDSLLPKLLSGEIELPEDEEV
ncbi:restriction endonuclease subunit S [Enterococcus faecalis]|nr:restriction endonuclease subunit S [Enterococcus faecalis]